VTGARTPATGARPSSAYWLMGGLVNSRHGELHVHTLTAPPLTSRSRPTRCCARPKPEHPLSRNTLAVEGRRLGWNYVEDALALLPPRSQLRAEQRSAATTPHNPSALLAPKRPARWGIR